jgi:hypothetical protein
MRQILRDRLGHFKLEKDTYNTHFYELHLDHILHHQASASEWALAGEMRESALFRVCSSALLVATCCFTSATAFARCVRSVGVARRLPGRCVC